MFICRCIHLFICKLKNFRQLKCRKKLFFHLKWFYCGWFFAAESCSDFPKASPILNFDRFFFNVENELQYLLSLELRKKLWLKYVQELFSTLTKFMAKKLRSFFNKIIWKPLPITISHDNKKESVLLKSKFFFCEYLFQFSQSFLLF